VAERLKRYLGPLDAAGIVEGINVARRNATMLAKDARLLFEAKSFPRAAALAALSVEESGKTTILRQLALATTDEDLRAGWKAYRSHTAKNVMWMLPTLVASGARRLDDFRSLFDSDSEHPLLLDQIKQIAFYSDCFGKAHWSQPHEVIGESLASLLLKTAELLASGDEVSCTEIKLWIKHMKPVAAAPADWQRKALANWYSEMQATGLKALGPNEMEEFIWRGLGNNPDTD
jgi:AbiV family abortive infection protein